MLVTDILLRAQAIMFACEKGLNKAILTEEAPRSEYCDLRNGECVWKRLVRAAKWNLIPKFPFL